MKKINSINFLRIIFMALILVFHSFTQFGFLTGFMPLDKLISEGAIAIAGFFMISGFTLRYSYEDRVKDVQGILTYIKNRIIGIYPAYIFLLIVSFLWRFRLKENLFDTIALIPVELTLTQTLYYIQMVFFSFNDNFWYVSAAFFLYMIFPGLNWVASQIRRPLLWIGIMTVFSEYVYWISITRPVIAETYYYINPFFRIPEFFAGILVCDLVKKKGAHIHWLGALFATVAFFVLFDRMYMPIMQWPQNYNLYNIIVIPYVAVLLVACAGAGEGLEKLAGSKPVSYLAGLGLTMYLCQSIPFAEKEYDYLHIGGLYERFGSVVMFFLLTILTAVLINAIVERPVKWFFRGRKEKRWKKEASAV